MRSPIPPATLAAALSIVGCGGAKASPEAAPAAVTPSIAPSDTTGLLRVRFARGTTSGLVNDSLQAGEIPVFACSNPARIGPWGELLSTAAKARGAAGAHARHDWQSV